MNNVVDKKDDHFWILLIMITILGKSNGHIVKKPFLPYNNGGHIIDYYRLICKTKT